MVYKSKIFQILFWFRPLIQVMIYLLIYELSIWIIKNLGLLKINLGFGITSKYLFYLYISMSVLLFVIQLFLKKDKLSHFIVFMLGFMVFSLVFFVDAPKFTLIIWFDVLTSLVVYYLFTRLIKNDSHFGKL